MGMLHMGLHTEDSGSMACIEQQVTSQWCHELVMPAKTAA